MDLLFFLNALLRKKWVIIICSIAGLSAGLLFTFTKKNMYMSAATYSTGFTMKQQVKMTTDEGLNIFEIDQRFKNVIETFKSPVVICMLSYDLMLHDLTEKMPFTTLSDKEKSKREYRDVNLEKAREILLEKRASKEILRAYDPEENKVYQLILLYQYDNENILDALTVDRVTGTDYLNIIYKSENPEMSAFVVNTIGKEFISFYNSITDTRTVESTDKLDTLAARKKREIDEKTQQLQKYKQSFNSPNIADRSTAALAMAQDQQSQLSIEQTKLNSLRADLKSVTENLAALENTPDNAVANNTELVELQRKNRDLAVDLQKKGGTDAAIEAQIAANQKRINQIQPAYSTGTDKADKKKRIQEYQSEKITIQNNIDAQLTTINSLQSGVRSYSALATNGAGADVLVSRMQGDIDLATKQYEQMTSALQNAQNINVTPDINFKQTLKGQPAIKPEHSGRKVTVAIGAISAFILSSLWILAIDFLDQSVRAPSLFNRIVNVRLLSVVNRIDLKHKVIDDYFNLEEDPGPGQDFMYLENLRKLRYEIESSGKKIILFTSTKPQEGKTTIIEALANSFSLVKKRVLLIDTNFSNNSLTEKFDAKPMLDQLILNGETNPGQKLATVNRSTKIPYVDIIGCRESVYSPDEILQKNNLLENLSKISSQYDYILLEGASLNDHADTKELLKYSEAIVVVFSAKSIIRQSDRDAIRFLKNQQHKLIGAVLNEVEKENIDL
jgi:succinoglycan biosynthesis transport protein ExoP